MLPKITNGEATFFAPEPSLWDMRQATKIAMRDGLPTIKFTVTCHDEYYLHGIDDLLYSTQELRKKALLLGDKITGDELDTWRCAALWQLDPSWSGVLLHRQGNKLLCAYIPLMDRKTAKFEHEVALALSQMAKEVRDMPVLLERGIPAGQHSLSEILDILSEGTEV